MKEMGEEGMRGGMMTISPFEQFEINRLIPIGGDVWDISITNSTVYMMIAVGVYMLLYKINIEKGRVVPGR